MASSIPNAMKGRLLGDNAQITAAVDMEADTMRLMLLTSSHTPNDDTDLHIDTVNTNEVSTSGSYTAGLSGGALLTPTSSTNDSGDTPANKGIFDADDVSFTTATITARYAIIYKDTGTANSSPIVCTIDFGTDKASTAGTFSITFASEGIINLG